MYFQHVEPNRVEFWRKFPGLVWSNPEAGDSVYLRAALLRASFTILLAAAKEFGLDRLRQEWKLLDEENTHEAERARNSVERILGNIEKGFQLAAEGN
jgi:hypothetical protein